MAGGDKRAKLLSDLLAAKGGASALPAEPEHASVIQIADRRLSEDRASEPAAAPSVLYSKGAATASSFRPSYWSFDHDQQSEPTVEPAARVEPVPPAPIAPAPHVHNSKPLPVNFVIGFGCLALVVSTSLFVLSVWHRAELPAARPEPAPIALASAPVAPVIVLPSQPPAGTIAAPPAPAPALVALAPADPTPAPAPPPAALAPAPAPASPVSAPAPVVSEPPPAPAVAVSIAGAPIEPAPVVASTPATSPNPPADAQQAAALLARGDDLLATGDVAAARLFYQRAAEQGSASAATAVGQTYDPAVLELLRVRGARGDAQMAAEWYRKAIAAGDLQAEIRLKRLLARTPG